MYLLGSEQLSKLTGASGVKQVSVRKLTIAVASPLLFFPTCPQSPILPFFNLIMSNYPQPPPSYGSTSPSPKRTNFDETAEPLLAGQRFYQPGPSSGSGIYDQPAADDLPDDFKVCYFSINLT